jgi:UDP-2,4-diacetamido-2,4,6-trideoxy-beta-L-altropyranose hydrolase
LKNRILFRADGNNSIGLGHVMRSLALADILKEDFSCYFAIIEPSDYIKNQILKSCTGIIEIPNLETVNQEAQYFSRLVEVGDIMVLDGYKFDTEYQKIIKAKNNKLVCIDDLHQYHFLADVIISRAFGSRQELYSAEPYTVFYTGPEYAMLRSEFTTAIAKPTSTRNDIFICFGGADTKNNALKIIKSIIPVPLLGKLTILVSSTYLHKEELNEFLVQCENSGNFAVYSDIEAVVVRKIMEECEYAIVPASGVLFEVMASGLKTISGYTAADQYENYKYLLKNNNIFGLGNFNDVSENEIRNFVAEILNNKHTIKPIDTSVFRETKERYKELFYKLIC